MSKNMICYDPHSYPIAMDGKTCTIVYDQQKHKIIGMDSAMSPNDTDKVLKFLMSKLTPADLEQLDGMLDGDAPEPMASDARLGSDEQRRDWLRIGARARNAVRQGRSARLNMDAANAKGFADRFPDAARIRGRY